MKRVVANLRYRLESLALAHADLVAAGRAAVMADLEGEDDPLWYLRDALPPAPIGHPLNPGPGTDPVADLGPADRFGGETP